jgi:PAS domain S-box-containing protein
MPMISNLVNTSNLLPHGFCINWTPALLWLYVISDALIVLAYYSIPITLVYFVWHRKDLAFSKIFMMFGAFILACGTTHLLGIITLWHPIYWIDASMKAFTALISVVTAFVLIKLIPQALKLPTATQLNHEVQERLHAYEDLKLSQTTLQESEERLSLAVRSAGVGIWDWNLQTKQLIWDESMFELYNMKHEDFNNAVDAWEKSLHPEDRQRAENEITSAITDGKPFDTQFRIIRPNGEIRHIKAVAKVFFSNDGTPLRMLGTNIDVTESTIVDRMKSEFVTTAAHELRTPLTIINGYTELLNMDTGSKDEQREMLSAIHSQSQTMIHLLNDMLDVAKIEAQAAGLYQTELQQIGPHLQTLADTFITTGNHNKITFELSPNLPEVKVDIAKLEQAVKNCLSNAYKFSPKRGEVTMRVTEVMHDKQRKVLIAIEDQGIGMTLAQLERVFEKFYRADPSGAIPGTGLGMAIIKSIIEQHGGSIVIESEYGKGTKVMLYLPVA